MAKRRRKSAYCLNCKTPLHPEANYCPNCGQENTDLHVALRELLLDVLGNYFAFDTRWVRTFRPFLLNPGKLTRAFAQGQRLRYVNPLKLYLAMSLIFFFTFSLVTVPALEEDFVNMRHKLLSIDSLAHQENVILPDSLQAEEENSISLSLSTGEGVQVEPGGSETTMNFRRFLQLIESRDTSPEQLMDSLKLDANDFGSRYIATQLLKVGRNDAAVFVGKVLDWMPLAVILMLPLLAGFMWLLYLQKRYLYYVDHLIFMMHFQAVSFFQLALALLLGYFGSFEVGTVFFLLLNLIYGFRMFRHFYGSPWWATLLRMSLVSFFYAFVLSTGAAFLLVLVFLTY